MKKNQLWRNSDNKLITRTLNEEFFQKSYIIFIHPDTLDYKNVRYLHTPARVVSCNMPCKNGTILGLSIFVRNTILKSRLFNLSQPSFLHTYKKLKPVTFLLRNLLSKRNATRTNILSTVTKTGNRHVVKFNGVVASVSLKFIRKTVERVNNNLARTRQNCDQIFETKKLKKQMFNQLNFKYNLDLRRTKTFKKVKFRKFRRPTFRFIFNELTFFNLKK